MRNTFSANTTPLPALPSGGAFSNNSLTLWGQAPSKATGQNVEIAPPGSSGAVLSWTSSSADGNFRFTTDISVGDLQLAQYEHTALRRAACLYFIYHLNEQCIADA